MDYLDNCDKCRKPGFLRGNIYTSCISMVLLDHFANKSITFQHTLSLPLSLSHFLIFPPWVSTSSYPGKDTAIKGTLPRRSQGPRYLVTKLDDLFPLFWVNTNNPWVRCAYDNIFSFFTLSINTGSI